MVEDFIESQGNVFVAHRLRRSSDRIVEQVGEVLGALDLNVPPRGASMLLLIDQEAPIGVVEISRRLRLSHPLIVRMAQRFTGAGLAMIESDPEDARRRPVVPTAKGRREAAKIRSLNGRLSIIFDALFAETGCPLIDVLDRLDAALEAEPISQRLSTPTGTQRSRV